MKNKLFLAVTAASLLLLSACRKDIAGNLSEEETQIYITRYDSTAVFRSFNTYSISDSVAVIGDGHQYSKQRNATDDAYIAAVDKYMQQRGFVKVARENGPDLGITLNQLYFTSTGVISNDYYWDYYGSFWDPGYWGYGDYGYYLPYVYGVYQVTEGALSVDMLDLKNAAAKNQISVVWTGLIRGEGIYNASLADGQIGALFNQSTYLGH